MRHLICAAILALAAWPARAQQQPPSIAIPPTVNLEGMPPIPASIADDLARYGAYRDA